MSQTAIDIKHHLDLLALERAEARKTTLLHDPVYMADLEQEIAVTQRAFIASAVIEIATLRADLDRPNWG